MIGAFATAALLVAAAGLPAHAAPSLVCEAQWRDDTRDRIVPVRVRMPAGGAMLPVVLFSHGLGGTLDAGTDWAEAWSAAGIATIHLQHPGSDESIWKAQAGREAQLAGLQSGASPKQSVARVGDVRFALDELGRRRNETLAGGCRLARLDRTRVGISGHSFGAVTTQAIAGQRFRGSPAGRDGRVMAAIAFSPSPAANVPDTDAFGAIAVPFLSITGTADATPLLQRTSPADRVRPYAGMTPGDKYLLVLEGADHAIFNGHRLRRKAAPGDDHVRTTTALITTKFWQAYLLHDSGAASWLKSRQGAASALLPADRFEFK